MNQTHWSLGFATLVLSASVHAQTSFPEVEPNDNKAGANLVPCMTSGDSITGTTTGLSTTVAGAASSDNFRLSTCALTPGIYRHRLAITTAGPAGHLGSIRGLTQTAYVVNTTTDAAFQTASATVVPTRTNQWYGFGLQEEIYYRVTGAAATTAAYTATLTTAAESPTVVPGSFLPGSITIDCTPQTSADTEMWLYDGAFNPIAGSDEPGLTPLTARPAKITETLAAGTYTVAVSNWNTANNLPLNPLNDIAGADTVLDFPNSLANNSTGVSVNCSFQISDGVTTSIVALTKTASYELLWATFTVGTPPAFNAFCFGDGTLTDHTTPCPCGNNGAPGNGCGHSFDANGANMSATGTPSLDDVVLHTQFEPASSFTLMMQHANPGDVVFHDGVLCAGNPLIRLRGRAAVGGEAFFPNSNFANDSTTTLSQRGGTFPGSGQTMRYAGWYRNASSTYCPPATANVTNGWVIDW